MQIPDNTTSPIINRNISPLKHKFITFQSYYDYGEKYSPLVTKILIKNPKWCHLSLKLGHTGEHLKLLRLHRARSLRLRSVHLESYALDSQGCGDSINRYFGDLDAFIRSGQTLKKLSLSVIHCLKKPTWFEADEEKTENFRHLKKFVKKQKYIDEFGVYMGSQGNSKWMSSLLRYVEKTVKILTIENMTIGKIFRKHEFPKLEILRFEYMQFYRSENFFDFSILRKSLQDILALPSLKTLVFSQYQRYPFHYVEPFDKEALRPIERLELVPQFWEELRTELDKSQDKPLRIKYHKMDDANIPENVENFKRIFKGLPLNQTFEYEIALPHEELKDQGLKVETRIYTEQNENDFPKGNRYLISLDRIEPL